MHRKDSQQQRVRAFALIASVVAGAACARTVAPPTAPQPVVRPPQLVPSPASLVTASGAAFNITRATGVSVDTTNAEVRAIGEMLAALIRRPTGFPVAVTSPSTTAGGVIILRLAPERSSLGGEGYELNVTTDSVRLVAASPAGLFRGIQTVRQLLPVDIESEMGIERSSWTIPALTIVDQPRFAWRGAMLDVARHFFTVREVQQYIDVLALYKLNVLHLHLADDHRRWVPVERDPLRGQGDARRAHDARGRPGGVPRGSEARHQ